MVGEVTRGDREERIVSNELAKGRNIWKLFMKTLLNHECVINDLGYTDTCESIRASEQNIFSYSCNTNSV